MHRLLCMMAICSAVIISDCFAVTTSTARPSTARPSGSVTSGNFGLGVMLGEPTGLSAKYWLSDSRALDFGATYSFNSYFALLIDYLWHFPQAFSTAGRNGSEFVPYVGIGGILFVNSSNHWTYDQFGRRVRHYNGYGDSSVGVGVRIPLGLEFLPKTVPLGVFAELVPGVGVIPGLFGFFQGDVGIRFYF